MGVEDCGFHLAMQGEIDEIKRILDRKTRLIDELYVRVGVLEVKDAAQSEQIHSLCSKMDELANTIRDWMKFAQDLYWKVLGAAGVVILTFAGFFFWYIQSIPR